MKDKLDEAVKEKAEKELYEVYKKLGDYFEGPWDEYADCDFSDLAITVNKNWWIG